MFIVFDVVSCHCRSYYVVFDWNRSYGFSSHIVEPDRPKGYNCKQQVKTINNNWTVHNNSCRNTVMCLCRRYVTMSSDSVILFSPHVIDD